MTTEKIFRSIALGAIALGVGLFALRTVLPNASAPSSYGTAENPAAHARDPIHLIPADARLVQPDFSFRDADGTLHHLKDDVGNHPVLIHFWATWCGPCLPELPGLNTLNKAENARLIVLPIALDRDAIPTVQKFFADNHIDALPALAPGADLPIPEALPTSILLDKQGRVAWKTAGAHPWNGPDTAAILTELN